MKNLFLPKIRILWLALGIVSLIYSFVIYSVGSGTGFFLVWIAVAGFFALLFLMAGKGRWKKIPSWIRKTSYAVMTAAGVLLCVCAALIFTHFGDKGAENLDYIIVLGAQMRENGPSTIFKYRLDAAWEYMQEHPGTKCVVTGGRGYNEPVAEGEGGRAYLISKGAGADAVLAETESVNTKSNIVNALEIIKSNDSSGSLSIGIATNNFHVYRGVKIAQALTGAGGSEICGIAGYSHPVYLPNNILRECFGIIKDFLFGNF